MGFLLCGKSSPGRFLMKPPPRSELPTVSTANSGTAGGDRSQRRFPTLMLATICAAFFVTVLDKTTGKVLGTLGRFGFGPDELDSPHGLAWDLNAQLLYVADTGNNRVSVYGYVPPPSIVVDQQSGDRPTSLTLPSTCCGGISSGTGVVVVPPITAVPSIPPTTTTPPSQTGLILSGVTVSPNPFEPRNGEILTIGFNVNGPASVTVAVYDKQDRVIYQFPQINVGPGSLSIQWNGLTSKGTNTPPGSYVIHILATNGTDTVNSSVEVAVANKGGNVPVRATPKGRADKGGH